MRSASARHACIVLAILLTAPALGWPLLGQQAPSPPPYAIVDARIEPMRGPVVESGTLVLRSGRIEAVGAGLTPPDDAIVIDGEGWTLYPGFIDAHSSVGMPSPERQPTGIDLSREASRRRARGEPTPGLDPHVDAAALFDPDEDALRSARHAGVTAAAVAPTDGILRGQAAIVAMRDGQPRRAVIRDRWAQHVGMEPFSRQRNDYPGTLMGVLATIRQHYHDAAWYEEAWSRFDADPASIARPVHDERLAALGASQAGRQPVVFDAWSDNGILRAVALADELDLEAVVSGATDAWRVSSTLAEAGLRVLVSLDQRPRRDPSGFGAAPPGGLMRHPGAEDHEEARANPARLHDAGIEFAFTSHGLERREDLLPNLRATVEAGLPRDAALRALTIVPADVLGVADRLGSLEVGKLAHVVAVEGDLFAADGRVAAVWVDGELYEGAGEVRDGDRGPTDATEDARGAAGSRSDEEDQDAAPDAGDRRAAIERRAPTGPLWPEAPVTAIRHATILTVSDGTIGRGTIVMRDGVIAAVGPDDEVTVPAGAREIDATGLHVMPGIVDAHIHIAMAGGGNESTEAVTPEVRIADVIDHRTPAIFRALTVGVTTVNVLHGSANVIGGQNAVLKMRWGRPAADLFVAGAQPGVKFALGENPTQSNRPRIPGVDPRYPGTRMGVERELRTSFEAAERYRAAWQAYEAARAAGEDPVPPRRNLRMEALVGILEGDILVHAHSYRSDEILMLLRVAEEFGFRIASLQHVLEGYKVADEIAAHGAGASTFADGWGYKMEAFDAIPYNMAIMAERGVTVSVNSDAVGELATRLYQEAAKAVKYGGVSETEALKMITLNPASHLRLDDRIGSIEVGKDADLAVFTAHPFSADARVRYTVIDGQIYFDSDRVEVTDDALESAPSTTDTSGSGGQRAGTNGERGTNGDGGAPTQPSDGSRRPLAERYVDWQPSGQADVERRPGYGTADAPSVAAGSVAIVGGRIETMAGPPIESGTVLIRDGRIAAVGSDVSVPAGTRTIDARGRVVTPGIINAGTSLGLSEIGAVSATQDANEIDPINASVRAAVAINPHSEMLPVTRVNGVTTAVSAPGGGIVNGQSALVDLVGWTAPELLARSPLAMHVDYPEIVTVPAEETAADAARERVEEQRDDLRQWMRRARAFAGALAADADQRSMMPDGAELAALVPVVRGELPVVLEAQSAEGIASALAFADEFGLDAVLAAGRDVWRMVEEIAAAGVPVLLGPLPGRAAEHDPYDAVVAAPRLLHDAGVPFAFRTGGATNARNLPYHAAMAVAHGLPRDAAWRAMTRGAAEILGVAEHYGTLEPGKIANVVVADGDLLDVPTQVHHVLIRGREVEMTSRHIRLWRTFSARPAETRD